MKSQQNIIVIVKADLIPRPQDQGEIQKGRQGDQDEIQPDQGLDWEDQKDGWKDSVRGFKEKVEEREQAQGN